MQPTITINKSLLSASPSIIQNLIASIDQGTSSTRFLLITKDGSIFASSQMEHSQIYPSTDFHEHNPMEIWRNTQHCINALSDELTKESIQKISIKGVGITNQRETTIAWNYNTGIPYYNAIVWDDLRTADIVHSIEKNGTILTSTEKEGGGDYTAPKDRLRSKTGLPLATYFAGTKVRWLVENVPELQKDLLEQKEKVCFGTIDSWLVYQLTSKKLFLTDVTNASRWLFLDIHAVAWDSDLIKQVFQGSSFKNPELIIKSLPEIKSSSEIYGACCKECGIELLSDIPIASILGDQQAALFGQAAFHPGHGKCTYGTGVFLLMNTGTQYVPSYHGLLSTIAYQIGSDKAVQYALEGSVSHSGSTIQWLRDQLCLISNAAESETLAKQVKTNDGLYFVPAFSGLFAPYWRTDARGCIVGMTTFHTKSHICRAALEATAYQVSDLFDAIHKDTSNLKLQELKVDGGATQNELMMQFQADMIQAPVIRPKVMETTALGAAFAAGLAVGVWESLEEISKLWGVDCVFNCQMHNEEREGLRKGWRRAVDKSFGWVEE